MPLVLIVDAASMHTRAGYNTERLPMINMRSVVGRPRHHEIMIGIDNFRRYYGEEALRKRGILDIKIPIDMGIIVKWDEYRELQKHIINELNYTSNVKSNNFFFTQPPLVDDNQSKKLGEIVFEKFEGESLHLRDSNSLALFASGRTSGLVLNSGGRQSICSVILEGTLNKESIKENYLAGYMVDAKFQLILSDRGYTFTTSAERELLARIKERLGFVPTSKNFTKSSFGSKSYELPDGQRIAIENEQWDAPNILFDENYDSEVTMQKLVSDCLSTVPSSLSSSILGSITLAGGNTNFAGFDKRLENELQELNPTSDISVGGSRFRSAAAWVGASIVSSLPNYINSSITKQAFHEIGENIFLTG